MWVSLKTPAGEKLGVVFSCNRVRVQNISVSLNLMDLESGGRPGGGGVGSQGGLGDGLGGVGRERRAWGDLPVPGLEEKGGLKI